MMALALQACASVQSHPSEALSWRTPHSFEPVEAQAPALFEAQGRRSTAAVYRLEHAYAPAQALAAYRLTLQRDRLASVHDTFDTEPAGPGQWWIEQSRDAQLISRALITTTSRATWVVRLQSGGEDDTRRSRKTLSALARGISPELRPVENASADLPLGQALGAPDVVSLAPPDASGVPRRAQLRAITAPLTLIEGYALAEPLTYALSAEAYLALLMERYAEQLPVPADSTPAAAPCGPSCQTATLSNEAWTYVLVATTSGAEARHLLLWHPGWSDAPSFLAPRDAWLDDFSQRAVDVIEVPQR
ncbi:hypothetical protein FRC96_06535 [Lujinxingia vulgaris]|uniref:Uncharacterized protein n=1 Tax=Lujinxingia vulgaris TaxID=2600176 RepID=A0A5C6XKZ4_9DELT|nr:hypothetical protein [Lujinxingia vulgaris]TXD39674.1 hypothetical protein FRC96_06535 [Lujinxingia vulgaris]